MKIKLNNILIISIFLVILIGLIILYIKWYKTDTFVINPSTTKLQPLDRTQLYGALFLENLDKTIKNLSNPDIQYQENRIQLNNYSDILL
jgi:cell shape-determining protein MreC